MAAEWLHGYNITIPHTTQVTQPYQACVGSAAQRQDYISYYTTIFINISNLKLTYYLLEAVRSGQNM